MIPISPSVPPPASIEFPDARPLAARRRRLPQRGQSLAEFALVVSVMLVLVVAVADFGRIFAAGLVLEAAARNASEVAANEYLATPPGPINVPAPPADSNYYSALRLKAARTACAEVRDWPTPSTTLLPRTARECH